MSDGQGPAVSVVIPAYNCQATLQRTLDSVLNQTWRQLQVILVDDGSTDQTGEIARRAAEKDPRLTVITRENGGVSGARNTGLDVCTGKYIRFVDADDTLPPESVEHMVLRAEKDGSGFVIGGFNQYIGNKSRYHNLADRGDTVPCDDMLPHLCLHANSYFYGVPWNKLYVREIAEKAGCRFQEDIPWGEDFAFAMDYLRHVDTVSFMREAVYDYRRTKGSISIRQVADCAVHPMANIRVKQELYRHMKDMYISRGRYGEYRKKLWTYWIRVGLG